MSNTHDPAPESDFDPEHYRILTQEGVTAWNAWRAANPEVTPKLRGAMLHEVDLRKVDLQGADLREVNLFNSRLMGANLTRSRMSGAFVDEADLQGALLHHADLTDAKLGGSSLGGAEFWNADLTRASLTEAGGRAPSFKKAILQNAELSLVTFRDVDLDDSVLTGANLSEAKLQGVSARSADLRHANLTEALIARADLTGADLRQIYCRGLELYESDLSRVSLAEADLIEALISGCTLNEVEFGRTILAGVRFRESTGLDSSYHSGPSWLDPAAALTIPGQAEGFFRGIGWPERLIENWQALTAEGLSFYSCFISYSEKDLVFARRLHDALQDRGVKCWLDKHAVFPGDDLHDEIDRGIRIWDKTVLCCSEASLTSWWVDQEIEKALQKEERLWKERQERVQVLIPIRLDDFVFGGWESGKKSRVTARHIGDFQNWDGDEERVTAEFERLVVALSSDPFDRGLPPQPKL